VTSKRIISQEHAFVKRAYTKWAPIKNIHILGPSSAERLPIFSLVIEFKDTKRMLHHNYVSSLLNDLFGESRLEVAVPVQARMQRLVLRDFTEDSLILNS